MIKFKDFIKNRNLPVIRTVDFRDRKLPTIRTVDFRDRKLPTIRTVDFKDKNKTVNENIHGETSFNVRRYMSDTRQLNKRLHDHYEHSKNNKIALKDYTLEHRLANKATREQTKAKGHYSSKHINSHLHKSGGVVHPDHESHIKKLDRAIKAHKAPEDFHVYSGLHKKPQVGLSRHHGYMSTSTNREVARGFADKNGGKGNHILKIKIKKDSKHGTFIGKHSHYDREHEFMVKRGAKLRIHPDPEVHTIYGEKYHVHHAEIEG